MLWLLKVITPNTLRDLMKQTTDSVQWNTYWITIWLIIMKEKVSAREFYRGFKYAENVVCFPMRHESDHVRLIIHRLCMEIQ